MTGDTTDLVRIERHGGVVVVRLNVPERRNVLSAELVAAVGQAFDEIEAEPQARCVIVTGEGPAFCAGADLGTLEAAADGDFDRVRVVYDGFLRIRRSPLVTIAAVNGPAVGAGFNIALACDVRLAARSARFDTRFARLRIHPGGGHAWMLVRAVGAQRATMAIVFGEVWDAATAKDVGLIAEVYPDDELLRSAIALGSRLDDYDGDYLRRLVDTVRRSVSVVDHVDALEAEAEAQEWSTTQPGFRHGVAEVLASVRRS